MRKKRVVIPPIDPNVLRTEERRDDSNNHAYGIRQQYHSVDTIGGGGGGRRTSPIPPPAGVGSDGVLQPRLMESEEAAGGGVVGDGRGIVSNDDADVERTCSNCRLVKTKQKTA